MGFVFLTLAGVAVVVGVLLLVGRMYPGSGADLLDWKPTRSYEDEARMEMEDVQQMLDAQNEYRRKRGAPEMTEEEIRRRAAEDEELRQRHERWS
jgi:hypothetical protein